MDTPHPQTWKFLDRKPKSNYKQLVIKGRNIRARTLYGAYMSEECPMTMEEIAADRDLPLEAVQEAIAYCQSNPPEIEEDSRREEARVKSAGLDDPESKYGGKYNP